MTHIKQQGMPTPLSKENEEVLAKFDEEFIVEPSKTSKSGKRLVCDPDFAKSFLLSALLAKDTKLQRIVERIEKMKLIEASFPNSSYTLDWKRGHNKGVDKILAILKEEI